MGGFTREINKVPAAILRSPLHGLMSKRYLLLSFTAFPTCWRAHGSPAGGPSGATEPVQIRLRH